MRVTAGTLKGRRLAAPKGLKTRPTADRVRQAVFSILADVRDARVVDLYAGTGALGIEALSRGASTATFVESGRAALGAIRANIESLTLSDRCRVVTTAAERASLERFGPFDLVFCDPPWDSIDDAMTVVSRLAARGVLAPGARLAIEHAKSAGPTVLGTSRLEVFDERFWGDSAATFLTFRPPEVSGP